MGINTNITKTAVSLSPRVARRLEFARPGAVVRALFVTELLERQLSHIAQDRFPGSPSSDQLAELGRLALLRADGSGNEIEALLHLPGDRIAFVDVDYGTVTIEVAGAEHSKVQAIGSELRTRLASSTPAPDGISVAFWIRGEQGGDVRHREIDAPKLEQIASNYSADVRDALERLAAIRAPERGRLILWRGEPGTGKSHALRALVRAWAPWCSAHFVIDPEDLLTGGAYMLDVLAWEDDDQDRWRLLILEDAGELIASDARAVAGHALSRLLNVADGLLGQGTRTLILITTNEPVKRLHPATRRAGRCLAEIEFAPLPVAEANAWLVAHGHDQRVEVPTAIADLFSRSTSVPVRNEEPGPARFGFARALDGADARDSS
jgi:hypothetical protein